MVRCMDCQEIHPRAHALQARRPPLQYRVDYDALCYPSVLGIQAHGLHLPNPLDAIEVLVEYQQHGRTRSHDCGECLDWTPEQGLVGRPGRVITDTATSTARVAIHWVDETGPRPSPPRDCPDERWIQPAWRPDPGPQGACAGCSLSYLDRLDGRPETSGYRPRHRGSYRDLADLPSERTRARFWERFRRVPEASVDHLGTTVDVDAMDDQMRVNRAGICDRPTHAVRVKDGATAVFSSARDAWIIDSGRSHWRDYEPGFSWRRMRDTGITLESWLEQRERDVGWSACRWAGARYRFITG